MGKCIYCDFYSGGNPDWERYVAALLNELGERAEELKGPVGSIYIGGGTPSLMPERYFVRMMEGVREILKAHDIKIKEDYEFTIEVNPEDVTPEKIRIWKENGVNRVSIGIQSLDNELLRKLKRRHTAERAIEAVNLIKSEIDNISVDIIYGIPGQTEESLKKDIEKILEFRPAHVSAYSLTYEPGTALTVLRDAGKIKETPEEESLRLGRIVERLLVEAGYERYEISNYALPGKYSRHNTGYWEGKAYVGLGPSAASYDGNVVRRSNPADLKRYLERFEKVADDKMPFYIEDRLDEEAKAIERVFLSLRRSRGLDLEQYGVEFGSERLGALRERAKGWVEKGKMELVEGRLRFTREGWEISDYVLGGIIV